MVNKATFPIVITTAGYYLQCIAAFMLLSIAPYFSAAFLHYQDNNMSSDRQWSGVNEIRQNLEVSHYLLYGTNHLSRGVVYRFLRDNSYLQHNYLFQWLFLFPMYFVPDETIHGPLPVAQGTQALFLSSVDVYYYLRIFRSRMTTLTELFLIYSVWASLGETPQGNVTGGSSNGGGLPAMLLLLLILFNYAVPSLSVMYNKNSTAMMLFFVAAGAWIRLTKSSPLRSHTRSGRLLGYMNFIMCQWSIFLSVIVISPFYLVIGILILCDAHFHIVRRLKYDWKRRAKKEYSRASAHYTRNSRTVHLQVACVTCLNVVLVLLLNTAVNQYHVNHISADTNRQAIGFFGALGLYFRNLKATLGAVQFSWQNAMEKCLFYHKVLLVNFTAVYGLALCAPLLMLKQLNEVTRMGIKASNSGMRKLWHVSPFFLWFTFCVWFSVEDGNAAAGEHHGRSPNISDLSVSFPFLLLAATFSLCRLVLPHNINYYYNVYSDRAGQVHAEERSKEDRKRRWREVKVFVALLLTYGVTSLSSSLYYYRSFSAVERFLYDHYDRLRHPSAPFHICFDESVHAYFPSLFFINSMEGSRYVLLDKASQGGNCSMTLSLDHRQKPNHALLTEYNIPDDYYINDEPSNLVSCSLFLFFREVKCFKNKKRVIVY